MPATRPGTGLPTTSVGRAGRPVRRRGLAVKRERGPATLVVEPLRFLPDPAAVEEEVTRLLEFLAAEYDRRTIELAAW